MNIGFKITARLGDVVEALLGMSSCISAD